MEPELLRTFFGWCTVINAVLYGTTIVANLVAGILLFIDDHQGVPGG